MGHDWNEIIEKTLGHITNFSILDYNEKTE